MSISRAVGVRINVVSLRAVRPLCRLAAGACRVEGGECAGRGGPWLGPAWECGVGARRTVCSQNSS